MKLSTERILTTHVGSLTRPPDLFDMLAARASGQPYDAAAFEARVRQAVVDIVRRQAELGIDIIDDGEQGKPGFVAYISERLAGFEARPAVQQGPTGPEAGSRELQSFPEFYAQSARRPAAATAVPPMRIVCTGPITYRGRDAVQRDIATFKAALQGVRYAEAFLPAVSVTNIASGRRNEYYPTEDEFMEAIARAIHEEYRAIVDAGFVLQIDDPRLSTYYNAVPALGGEARGVRQPGDRRYSAGPCALPHLLQHRHWPPCPRHAAQGHRRYHAQGQRRCLLVRGVQPASRARVPRLGDGATA